MKILIIDDSIDYCVALHDLIKREFEFRTDELVIEKSYDGTTGIKKFKEMEPDITFVDLCFEPVQATLQGYDICKALKKEDSSRIVVLLTGYNKTFPDVKKILSENLVYTHLPKSPNTKNIKNLIDKLMQQRYAGAVA